MKKILFAFAMLIMTALSVSAHQINNYKYIFIQHQEDAPKDIESRMEKEFSSLGFTVLSSDEFAQLPSSEQSLVLNAEYLCIQSAQCLFHIWLKNTNGEEVYEDEQVAAGGFMTKKNDRQSALKKIFKEIKKLNYQFEGDKAPSE